MAKLITLDEMLRFRDSNSETQTEQEVNLEPVDTMVPVTRRELPPFQRAKNGAGEFSWRRKLFRPRTLSTDSMNKYVRRLDANVGLVGAV